MMMFLNQSTNSLNPTKTFKKILANAIYKVMRASLGEYSCMITCYGFIGISNSYETAWDCYKKERKSERWMKERANKKYKKFKKLKEFGKS